LGYDIKQSNADTTVSITGDKQSNCILIEARFPPKSVCTEIPKLTFKGLFAKVENERVCNQIPTVLSLTVRYKTSFARPAVAQAGEAYYLVQDTKTKTCKIVEQKPINSGEWTMVNPEGRVYKTKSEAESAMKTVKVCTETSTSR
jgi:hypothetical protein